MRGLLAAAALAASVTAGVAQTSCGQFDFPGGFSAAWSAGEPYANAAKAAETITSMADARCHQDRLVAALATTEGPPVGYKAAATSPGAQKQLGLETPVLGILLRDMLHEDGAHVQLRSGARLILELDLLARVGNPAINAATTRAEALDALDAVIPFIEIGDLMVPKGVQVTGPLLQAMNAGARAGVVGEPVPIGTMSEDDLSAVSGKLMLNGAVVAQAPATQLLGHPLDAVLWIVDAARARGIVLQEGDLLSLGSMGPFQLAAPGEIRAVYAGLAEGEVEVSATLE